MKILKFKSKKEFLFQALILGTVGVCMSLIVAEGLATGLDKWNFVIINLLLFVCGFLVWSYYGTYYELTQTHLNYNCGPIKGGIEIKEIREIIKGKTLWVGLKPATSRKGLIIKYGQGLFQTTNLFHNGIRLNSIFYSASTKNGILYNY